MSLMTLNLLSHNSYCSVGVIESCLSNLLILTDCFLCNSYHCVLFESLSNVINQESHVYSWNLGKIYLAHFLKFSNLEPFSNFRFHNFRKKSELCKFIPKFPLKHVITSTSLFIYKLYAMACIGPRYLMKGISIRHQFIHTFLMFYRCLDYFQDENWGKT